MEDVNQMVDLYETILSETLNKHAPTISTTIVTRPKKPWYSDSVKWQKQVVRKRKDMEEIQTTPPLDSTSRWMRKVQNHAQHHHTRNIRNWDSWIGNNIKKLYSLVKHWTGTTSCPNMKMKKPEQMSLHTFSLERLGR